VGSAWGARTTWGRAAGGNSRAAAAAEAAAYLTELGSGLRR
jgi:hypothetical protein